MSGLYDGRGDPLCGSSSIADQFAGRPVCRLLFDLEKNPGWSGGEVDRQWLLPIGSDPLPVPADVLADLMVTLDTGGRIAVLAADALTAEIAIGAVLALASGTRA